MRPHIPLWGQPRPGAGGAEAPQRRRPDRALASSRRRRAAAHRARDPRTVPDPDRNGGARRPARRHGGRSRPAGAFRRRDPADLRRGGPQPLRISQGERRLPRCGDGACRQSSASRAGGAAAVAAHHGAGRRRPDAGGARGFSSGAPRHRAGYPRARPERRVGAHARPSRARGRARARQSRRGPRTTRPGRSAGGLVDGARPGQLDTARARRP